MRSRLQYDVIGSDFPSLFLIESFSSKMFILDEIQYAVMGSKGALCLFYQQHWDLVKEDLATYISDFTHRTHPLNPVNCYWLYLIPKREALILTNSVLSPWQIVPIKFL